MKNEPNERVDDLVEQLEQLRLEREETERVYQRAVAQSNNREKELLKSIRQASSARINNAVNDKHKSEGDWHQRQRSHQTKGKQF